MNNQYDPYNNYNQYNDSYNNYNQYNNGMNQQNYSQYNGNQNNRNDNRGGGILSFLLALILLIGCVAFLLDYTEAVDVKSYIVKYKEKFFGDNKDDNKEDANNTTDDKKGEEETSDKNPSDESTEPTSEAQEEHFKSAVNMCNFVDETGNYTEDDNKRCLDNACTILVDQYYYTYDCKTGEKRSGSAEELRNETLLSIACGNVDENGNYTVLESGIKCTNNVCTVNSNGKTYTRQCNLEE